MLVRFSESPRKDEGIMGANVTLSDETAVVHVVVTDKPVETMSDRELLEELVTFTRVTSESLKGVAESLSTHPMLKMLGGSFGSLFGGK
jgi:hypothetical protein